MNGVLTMGDILAFAGTAIGLLGAALAVGFACYASGRGTGAAGEAGAGLLAENPNMFGKVLIMQVLPGTQGLYGLVIFFFTLVQLGTFADGLATLTLAQGLAVFAACLPMAFGGLTAIPQGRVAAAAIGMMARQEEGMGKGIILCIIVEFYAILCLLASILLLINLGL